jgi:DNA-binding CsgD family transcriptional regulator
MVEHLNKVGYITSFIFAFYNGLSAYVYHKPLYTWFTHVLLFFILGVILLINKKTITYIIIFLMIGYFSLATGESGNYGGVIYLCFAATLIKKVDYKIYSMIIGSGVIFVKGILLKLQVFQFVVLILGAAVTAVFYFIITSKKRPKINIGYHNNKEEMVLDMITRGLNTKSIALELNISQNQVNKYIKAVRDRAGCETTGQLFWELAKLVNKGNNNDKQGQIL